ncbi:MAG: CarD family transcriptional regulator [Suipraeoptans sp.]
MFNINELVVYGNTGLCVVSDIGALEMDTADKSKTYYTLTPMTQNNSHIYAPVDSSKIVLRKINSESQCKELVNNIPCIKPGQVTFEKDREKYYRTTIRSCDLTDIVSLIKLLYIKRIQCEEQGKKLNNTDKNYLALAENALFSELTTVLDINEDDVKRLINEHLKVA